MKKNIYNKAKNYDHRLKFWKPLLVTVCFYFLRTNSSKCYNFKQSVSQHSSYPYSSMDVAKTKHTGFYTLKGTLEY